MCNGPTIAQQRLQRGHAGRQYLVVQLRRLSTFIQENQHDKEQEHEVKAARHQMVRIQEQLAHSSY